MFGIISIVLALASVIIAPFAKEEQLNKIVDKKLAEKNKKEEQNDEKEED